MQRLTRAGSAGARARWALCGARAEFQEPIAPWGSRPRAVSSATVCLLALCGFIISRRRLRCEVWIALDCFCLEAGNTPFPCERVLSPARPARMHGETHRSTVSRAHLIPSAKTVADCFKSRNKIVFGGRRRALRCLPQEYLRGARRLGRFAKICPPRLCECDAPYLEAAG